MNERERAEKLRKMNEASKRRRLERERKVRKLKAIIAVVTGLLLIMVVLLILSLTGVLKLDKKNNKADKSKDKKVVEQEDDDLENLIASASDASSTDASSTDASATDATPKDFSIEMTFVGDCCMATNLENNSYGTLLWYESNAPTTYFFDGVRQYFEGDDITIANCENTFSDSSVAPRDKGEGTNYWFKSPSSFASVFSDNNIEAVTINNNHTNDYGPEVFEDTKAALDAAGVEWGFRDKIIYYEKEGYKIGVVCVSYYYYEEAEGILPYLELAKENSDFQIIFFHGGVEGEYQPEDWKVQACHMLVDNGADLILGAHPHVLQKRENYNGVDIVYSLGNFCFGGNDHPGSNRTIIYKYTLNIHSDGIEYTVQWSYVTPDGETHIISGANELTYTFRITSENAHSVYHVKLTPVQ